MDDFAYYKKYCTIVKVQTSELNLILVLVMPIAVI